MQQNRKEKEREKRGRKQNDDSKYNAHIEQRIQEQIYKIQVRLQKIKCTNVWLDFR